jgi:hypothetical protein
LSTREAIAWQMLLFQAIKTPPRVPWAGKATSLS